MWAALHDSGGGGQLGGLQVALGGPCGPLEVPEGPCRSLTPRIGDEPYLRPTKVGVLYRFDSHLRLVAKSLDILRHTGQRGLTGHTGPWNTFHPKVHLPGRQMVYPARPVYPERTVWGQLWLVNLD
jgi:hypothetical protein